MFMVESGARTSSCRTSSSRVLPRLGLGRVDVQVRGRVRGLDRPGVGDPEHDRGRLRLVEHDVAAHEDLERVEQVAELVAHAARAAAWRRTKSGRLRLQDPVASRVGHQSIAQATSRDGMQRTS